MLELVWLDRTQPQQGVLGYYQEAEPSAGRGCECLLPFLVHCPIASCANEATVLKETCMSHPCLAASGYLDEDVTSS